MIKIEKNEQFALIETNSLKIDSEISKEIETKIAGLYREGYSNYIFNFTAINEIEDEGLFLIKKVEKICKNENGILAIITENEEIIENLDYLKIDDLVIMATKEEAIEAIYLNELENDFREEEDESTEEYGEEPGNDFE